MHRAHRYLRLCLIAVPILLGLGWIYGIGLPEAPFRVRQIVGNVTGLPIVATVPNTTNKGLIDEFTNLEVSAENQEAAFDKDLATHPNGYLMTVSGAEQASYAKRAGELADRWSGAASSNGVIRSKFLPVELAYLDALTAYARPHYQAWSATAKALTGPVATRRKRLTEDLRRLQASARAHPAPTRVKMGKLWDAVQHSYATPPR